MLPYHLERDIVHRACMLELKEKVPIFNEDDFNSMLASINHVWCNKFRRIQWYPSAREIKCDWRILAWLRYESTSQLTLTVNRLLFDGQVVGPFDLPITLQELKQFAEKLVKL